MPLSGGDASRGEGALSTDVSIALTLVDLNALKLARIGTETNRTWLTVEAGAFRDMAGLPLLRIIQSGVIGGGALRASSSHARYDSADPLAVCRRSQCAFVAPDVRRGGRRRRADPESVVMTTTGQTERVVRDAEVHAGRALPMRPS